MTPRDYQASTAGPSLALAPDSSVATAGLLVTSPPTVQGQASTTPGSADQGTPPTRELAELVKSGDQGGQCIVMFKYRAKACQCYKTYCSSKSLMITNDQCLSKVVFVHHRQLVNAQLNSLTLSQSHSQSV